MRKKHAILLLILIMAMGIGFYFKGKSQTNYENFVSFDEVVTIYHDNRELINRIGDGLLSSEFVPQDGFDSKVYNSLYLFYDYDNKHLICSDDPQGDKLQIIQDIHEDAIAYFVSVGDYVNPSIMFREIRNMGVVIEFSFRGFNERFTILSGIMYTTEPEESWTIAHLEKNWYVSWFELG